MLRRHRYTVWGTRSGVAGGSSLVLYLTPPTGYQWLNVIPDLEWMSLIANDLSINGTETSWPGIESSPIAMMDTAGGPVFLSDTNGYVYEGDWPDLSRFTSTWTKCLSQEGRLSLPRPPR